MTAGGARGGVVSDLARLGTERSLRRGDHLFQEGDPATDVYVVLRGRLKACSVAATGKEVVLAIREPGDLVGELSAIDGSPRSARVTALEDAVVAVVTGERFREHLRLAPGAALELLGLVAARLRDADRKRAEFAAHGTTVRVARRLHELLERFEGDAPRFSQEELASWVGGSREAVARSLRQLRAAGAIRTARQVVEVVDADRLRQIAQTAADGRTTIPG